MKKTTIFRQLIFNILMPVMAALIILAVLNYINTKKILLNSFDAKNKVISEQVMMILQFQDLALEILEERLDQTMAEVSNELVNKYFKDTDSIEICDLKEIRKQIGMDTLLEDIYIINRQGIVVNTTFEKDLYLNFFQFGEQHKNLLLEIFKDKAFFSERIAQESTTKRLRKYSYQPTNDAQYIVEIGAYSPKANDIIEFVKSYLKEIEENQESILSVDLFLDPENPVSLNKNIKIHPGHEVVLKKAIETKQSQTIVEEESDRQTHYQYTHMGREKSNLYKGSVICIVSDMTIELLLLRAELFKSLLIFGSTMLIILLLFYNKIKVITIPIRNLVNSITNVAQGKIKERASVTGRNEITELSILFNQMLDTLEESYNDLIKAKDRAEKADKLKSAFLANMSHEIRTPMNSIIGFSDLLVAQDYETEERREFLGLINENAKSLLNLINEIIDIAKIESDQLKIFENECSINKVMKDLYLSFQQVMARMGKQNVEIRYSSEIEDEDFAILIDEQRFKQIVTNLVNNALKFTKQGYVEFALTLKDPFTLLFYVKDTGIGIPQQKQKIIFERFRQADDSHTREYGGTGLGLAITKNLVEILGGNIWVKSENGEGSTFYFTMPLKTAKPIDEHITKKFGNITNIDKSDWSNRRILVAEDEEVNFKLLEAILRETKAELIRVRNGEEAVQAIETDGRFDIILMDIKMPRMNGYEAARIIKHEKHINIPLIAQTAYAMAGEKEEILNSGFDEYISKPIKANELISLIKKYFSM